MRRLLGLALLLSGAAQAADPAAGEKLYAQCAACHAVSAQGQTAQALGPHLAGVIGRRAASADGFRYSPAMTRAGLTWDAATLDRFLHDPQAVVRGNRMPFAGIENATERADLVAYLATLQP